MADMPGQVPERISVSEQPRTAITSQDVESPYFTLAQGLDKTGEALNVAAEEMATQAGYKAVSRDDQGNLVVQKAPIIGPAAAAYSRAVKFSALAQGEAESRRKEIEISRQFQNDPDGYARAAQSYRDKLVNEYSKAAGPEVGLSLGRSVDDQITRSYRWLQMEQQRTIKENFDTGTKAAMHSRMEDAISLIQTGAMETPEGRAQVNKILNGVHDVANERVNNPVLHEDPEVGKLRIKQFDEEIGAAKHVDMLNRLLKDPAHGPQFATEVNDAVLGDTKISPSQRTINYAHGVAAIKDYQQKVERDAVMQGKQQHTRDQLFENAVIEDSSQQKPTVTENDIKTAVGVSPESKMRMLAWVKREGMPEPLAHVSQTTTMDLFRRMNLPDGDPQKITTLGPVRDAYAPSDGSRGKLTRADEEWLEKKFVEGRTPQGETLKGVRDQLNRAVEPLIDKSNPLMGKIDQNGKMQNYKFQRFIDQKVDEYRSTGKNPADLFDPGKPDFLGKPEILQQFQTSLQESLHNQVNTLTGQAPITPNSVRTVPIAPRQAGESVKDYLKRTGAPALPGAQ